jgi:hypothetical protein
LTLRIIINDAPEIEAAVRFHAAAPGLVHTRTPDGDTAELTGAAATIYLLRKDPGSGTRGPRARSRRPGTSSGVAHVA